MNIDNFIKICQDNGIPQALAAKYYNNKVGHYSVLPIYNDLVTYMECTIAEARSLFLDAWAKSKETGTVFVPEDREAYDDPVAWARAWFEQNIGKFGDVRYMPKPNATEEVILAGDLHSVFVNERALNILMQEQGKHLILMGDVMDCYSISRYGKDLTYATLKEEIAFTRALMEKLASRFETIEILTGNHELPRANKAVNNLMPNLLPLLVNPIELVCTGIDNISFLTHKTNLTNGFSQREDYNLNYLAFKGDLALSHHHKYYGNEAASQMSEWLDKFKGELGVKEINGVAHAHSHRLGVKFTPKGQVHIDTGCLCNVAPYQLDEGHNGNTLGYVKLKFKEDGTIDKNSIQIVSI